MYKFIISICFLFAVVNVVAQEQNKSEVKKDTIIYKTGYGIRVGIDISKPALALFDKSYSGLELVGDYRISKNWYVATELGYEQETTFEDYITSTSKGSYIKLGANYNAYENWLDMNNEIFVGMRYGLSIFDQSLDSYIPNVNNTYFPSTIITTPVKETGLTAHWTELQLGIKVEILNNLFLSFSGSYKVKLSVDDPEGFKSLYAPGFNRVYKSETGFGFNYTISYLIPFVKK